MLESRLKAVGDWFPCYIFKSGLRGILAATTFGGQHEQPRGPSPPGAIGVTLFCKIDYCQHGAAAAARSLSYFTEVRFSGVRGFFIGCFIRPCVMWGLKRSCKNIQKERPFFFSSCCLTAFWIVLHCYAVCFDCFSTVVHVCCAFQSVAELHIHFNIYPQFVSFGSFFFVCLFYGLFPVSFTAVVKEFLRNGLQANNRKTWKYK